MRLKEPLQGFKMAQGHVLMHWTFFIVCIVFVRKETGKPEITDYEACDEDHECEKKAD